MTLHIDAAPTARGAVLAAALRRADDGRGTLLVAQPGLGKTRALIELEAELARRGRRVAHLIGSVSAASVPFGVFLRLLEPATARSIAAADPLGRAMMIRAVVLELGLDAVLVDEVAAVDPASAAFLLELAQSGVAVLASLSEGRRVPDSVTALSRTGLVQAVQLPPLNGFECAELVRALLRGSVDEAAVRALREVSGGNPAVLRDLVREAVAGGCLVRSGELWRLTRPLPAPRALRRQIEERFDAAPEPLRRWIAAVAIAERVPMALAERLAPGSVTDRAEREGWAVYDAAQQAYRIPQQTHRAAILARVGTRERRDAIRSLVEAVASSPHTMTSVERIAVGRWRLELGDALPVDEALELAVTTSLAAPELCERFLREAVTRGGGAEAELALAEHMKRTGQIDEAEALLGAARSQTKDSHAVGEIARLLAIVTGIGGRRSAHALAVLDAHLADHPSSDDLQAVRAALLMRERRTAEALAVVQRIAARRGPTFAEVFAGIHEVLLRSAAGDGVRAARIVDELREPATRVTDRIPEGPVTMDWLAGWVPVMVALDVETGAAVAERNYDRMVELGMHAARTQFAHLLAVCRTLQGDPATAVQLLREAEGSPGIWRDSWLPIILGALTEALALSGDLAAARHTLERLRSVHRAPMHEAALRFAEAQVASSSGDDETAAAIARSIATEAAERGATVEAFDGFFAALRYGDDDAAHDLLRLGPLPEGLGRDLQRAHARAVVNGDARALDEAARRYWAADLRLFAMSAAVRSTQRDDLQRADGDRVAAAERIALWSLRVPALVLPAAPGRSLTALTTREREVVRLAAAGLPDRGIASELGISLRTAQTHLGRAFGKLGVHRRAELRALLAPAGGGSADG